MTTPKQPTEKASRIFIIEDDAVYCELLRNELQCLGYSRIECFDSGTEALDHLYQMPDIILLDYNLDEPLNGLGVLKQIKSFNPDIQVLLLSGQSQIAVAVDSLKYGAFDYLIKDDTAMPMLAELLQRIESWNLNIRQAQSKKRMRKALLTAGAGILALALLSRIVFPNLY